MEKEKGNASFCLSGQSKPFSHKREATNSEKKGRDLFSKFRSAPSTKQETGACMKERPRTAVKKGSNVSASQQFSLSRPSSASMNKSSYKSRFRFPALKSTQSIDSAVGSQQSSTDDDNKSSDDNEEGEDDSQEHLSSDEEEEESSADSGIMKVRLVSRNTEDSTSSSSSSTGSPTARAILVKEFNRTPDIADDEEIENVECEELIQSESEDEESKADILHTPKFTLMKNNLDNTPDEDAVINRDVVLMEVGPEDSSEIIPGFHLDDKTERTYPGDNEHYGHELTIDDIEYDTNIDKEAEICSGHIHEPAESHGEISFRSSVGHEVAEIKKEYDPDRYNIGTETTEANSSLRALTNNHEVPNKTDSYQDLIKSTIMRLENEESSFSIDNKEELAVSQSKEISQKTTAKEEDTEKEIGDRLSFEELENLKKKCLSRMKDHQSTPIVVNPPVINDFSNSQKLLNFLDEAEEKDKTILNSVKRSSYTIQVCTFLGMFLISYHRVYFLVRTEQVPLAKPV